MLYVFVHVSFTHLYVCRKFDLNTVTCIKNINKNIKEKCGLHSSRSPVASSTVEMKLKDVACENEQASSFSSRYKNYYTYIKKTSV